MTQQSNRTVWRMKRDTGKDEEKIIGWWMSPSTHYLTISSTVLDICSAIFRSLKVCANDNKVITLL